MPRVLFYIFMLTLTVFLSGCPDPGPVGIPLPGGGSSSDVICTDMSGFNPDTMPNPVQGFTISNMRYKIYEAHTAKGDTSGTINKITVSFSGARGGIKKFLVHIYPYRDWYSPLQGISGDISSSSGEVSTEPWLPIALPKNGCRKYKLMCYLEDGEGRSSSVLSEVFTF